MTPISDCHLAKFICIPIRDERLILPVKTLAAIWRGSDTADINKMPHRQRREAGMGGGGDGGGGARSRGAGILKRLNSWRGYQTRRGYLSDSATQRPGIGAPAAAPPIHHHPELHPHARKIFVNKICNYRIPRDIFFFLTNIDLYSMSSSMYELEYQDFLFFLKQKKIVRSLPPHLVVQFHAALNINSINYWIQ